MVGLCVWVAAHPARADDSVVPVLHNTHLRAQLAADPERQFGAHDKVVGGADVRSFTRGATSRDPGVYHSGMMADVFLEVDPVESLRANLRMSWIHPSFSSGIVSPAGLVIWPAVTGDLVDKPDTLTIRGGDFGRYRVGNGLLIQDESALGAMVQWRHAHLRVRGEWAGTGVIALYGDWRTVRVDGWDDAIGAYVATIGHGRDGIRDGLVGVHAGPRITPWLRPLVEAVRWQEQVAAMVALEARKARPDGWQGMVKVQGRHYPEGFGGLYLEQIVHDYVAIDQEAFDFVRADNLLVLNTGATVLAARSWLRIHPSRRTFLRFDGEVVRAWWPQQGFRSVYTVPRSSSGALGVGTESPPTHLEEWGPYAPAWIPFYRVDAGVCLRDHDNHCVLFSVNNRSSSGLLTPWLSDLEPKTLIEQNLTFGLELFARF